MLSHDDFNLYISFDGSVVFEASAAVFADHLIPPLRNRSIHELRVQYDKMYNSALLALASLASPTLAAYAKVWDYNSSNFLDAFKFVDVSLHPISLSSPSTHQF